MAYELWDSESINIINTYESERDALRLVLRAIERNEADCADTLALVFEDEHGDTHPIAYGQALVDRARREFAAQHLAG